MVFDLLSAGVFGFEDLDLLVRVHVGSARGEAGDEGAGEGEVRYGGVGVDCEGGPVVLVLEVVEDGGCEVV